MVFEKETEARLRLPWMPPLRVGLSSSPKASATRSLLWLISALPPDIGSTMASDDVGVHAIGAGESERESELKISSKASLVAPCADPPEDS